MTIAISIKVHDGIVLASDSASTLFVHDGSGGISSVANVYENANKIFNLFIGLPIGCITWGSGSIGTASISTLAKDLRDNFQTDMTDYTVDPHDYTIEGIAKNVKKFFYDEHYKKHYSGKKGPVLGFFIAGYSYGANLPELWILEMDDEKCSGPTLVREMDACGVNWGGDPDAVTRLIMGHGLQLPQILKELGVPEDQIAPAMEKIRGGLEAPVAPPPMPIQDAIDLGEFLVQTTISYSRFKFGASTVGGPIEIAAITKHEDFKWVKRKHYFSMALNQLPRDNNETDI